MNKKQQLLRTAATIIQEEGIQKLSMDYLAKRAGITKGGVLYHFESKGNLIHQMNELAVSEFETRITYHKNRISGPYLFTRAYALATLDYLYEPEDAPLIAVFISSQEDQDSGRLWRDVTNKWDEQFAQDGDDAADILELRLLCDGFWFAMVYGYSDSFKDRAAAIIRDKSERLVKGGS